MQPSTQSSAQAAKAQKDMTAEYTIQPLNYPADTKEALETSKQAFSKDPTNVYVEKHIKNPETFELRQHMREARFRNAIENLNPDSKDTEIRYSKLVHTPTNTIAGISSWQLPRTTQSSTESTASNRDPYASLPPGVEMPTEDAALSTLGPHLEALYETFIARIPLLGPPTNRNKHWWYLALLAIHPSHSGKRLGVHLVQAGVAQAREDARQRPEAGIRGAWVLATEAGLRTYENAGFTRMGEVRNLFGGLEGQGPGWDIVERTEENMKKEGQMAYVLVMEF